MRTFDTGATRDDDTNKLDYEGFFSPVAMGAYAEYLHKHRKQADGKMRASDNWQKGIGFDVYIKSAFRHFMDWWMAHRGYNVHDRKDGHEIFTEEAVCALIFNAFGYLHELLVSGRPPEAAHAAVERPDTCDCVNCTKKAA